MNKAANDLMIKARRAHKSALVLLKDCDFEGAVNRAYYAMHDVAKAALVHERVPGAVRLEYSEAERAERQAVRRQRKAKREAAARQCLETLLELHGLAAVLVYDDLMQFVVGR